MQQANLEQISKIPAIAAAIAEHQATETKASTEKRAALIAAVQDAENRLEAARTQQDTAETAYNTLRKRLESEWTTLASAIAAASSASTDLSRAMRALRLEGGESAVEEAIRRLNVHMAGLERDIAATGPGNTPQTNLGASPHDIHAAKERLKARNATLRAELARVMPILAQLAGLQRSDMAPGALAERVRTLLDEAGLPDLEKANAAAVQRVLNGPVDKRLAA